MYFLDHQYIQYFDFQPTTTEKALATDKLATISSSGAGNSAKSKELHLHTKARYQKDMRQELLGDDGDNAQSKIVYDIY